MWGESDSLLPKQTFEILDNLYTSVKEKHLNMSVSLELVKCGMIVGK